MIAPPDATDSTMLKAVAHSLAALDAASELDVDRTDDDRAFFAAEKSALKDHFDAVLAAQQALATHRYLTTERLQARIELGDVVLDRGVRNGKARMRLELKKLGDPEAVDTVFPPDIEDIVDAERRVEPGLVLQVVSQFPKVKNFPGKADLAADLNARANTQTASFMQRDAGDVTESGLDGALDKAIADASTALYRLEKRLLERFPREKRYVRAFFLDVAPSRKKKSSPSGQGSPGTSGDK